MKAYIVMVMVLALGVFGASSPAFADCPNHNVSCAWGATGWQGTCWKGLFKGCQDCGPKHCPNTIGYGAEQMPYQVRGACVQTLIAKGSGSVYHGCSSVPLNDPASNDFKAAFVGACDELNICYHVPGENKSVCDQNFTRNMAHVCDRYYTGARNAPMHGLCKATAKTWGTAAWLTGIDLFNNDQAIGRKMCK